MLCNREWDTITLVNGTVAGCTVRGHPPPPAFDSDTMDTARSTYYCAAAGRFVSFSSWWWWFHVAKRIGFFNRDKVQMHQKNGANLALVSIPSAVM